MNIPKEAVEAGAKAYRAKVEWIDRHSRDDYGREDELGMRAALEAAAPYMARPSLTPECFDQMVDAVLEHNGTPRHKLFKYPHRADDSRDMIRAAGEVVRQILKLSMG
jgi:hypothetical protein